MEEKEENVQENAEDHKEIAQNVLDKAMPPPIDSKAIIKQIIG